MGRGRGGGGRSWQRKVITLARQGELAAGVPETPVAASAILAEVQRMGLPERQNLLTPTVVVREPLATEYRFSTVTGNQVTLSIQKDKANGNSAEVAFSVNDDYAKGNIPELERRAITTRLLESIWLDAQSRPEGFRYHGYAYPYDGQGEPRAVAYQAVGFSPPYTGKAGDYQYGIVQIGRAHV